MLLGGINVATFRVDVAYSVVPRIITSGIGFGESRFRTKQSVYVCVCVSSVRYSHVAIKNK